MLMLLNHYKCQKYLINLFEIVGTLTPNGSFSMDIIQKVGTSFNHVGGFQ